MIQQFAKKIHGSLHHFAVIQGTDCVGLFTLWEGVCTNIFLFLGFVHISEYVRINNDLDNAPLSSDDEIEGVSVKFSYA